MTSKYEASYCANLLDLYSEHCCFIWRSSHVLNEMHNYDNVQSSHDALLQPTAHTLMPTGKVRKVNEIAWMMAGNADLTECSSCKRGTKYSCMKCKIPICNLCCQPEFDDNVKGWLSGKQVGYCYPCSRELNWKRKFLEDKTRRSKRNDEEDIREAEGNKDEA